MSTRQSSPAVGIVVQCELSVEIPAIAAPAPGMTALVLVRLFSEPIGMLSLTLSEPGLEPAELAAEIAAELGSELRERFADCAIAWTGSLPTNGLEPGRTPSFIKGRDRALAEGPEITVAICTRDRPDDLARALDSLQHQKYPRLRTLVVDNAPSDDRTRRLVSELARNARDRLCDRASPRPLLGAEPGDRGIGQRDHRLGRRRRGMRRLVGGRDRARVRRDSGGRRGHRDRRSRRAPDGVPSLV